MFTQGAMGTVTVPFLIAIQVVFWTNMVSCSEHLYVDRPRGVPLARKSLYDASKDFVCLDGSNTVPFSWVNDDYCDCSDGSDEPGTAACTRGTFHCVNLGHSPMNIPSSRVNDQICDCCDGGDEWSGLVNCANVCDEIGKQAREEAEKRAQVVKEGYDKRQEMIKDSLKLKQDQEKKLEELKGNKDNIDPTRDELEMKKQAAEKEENDAKDKFREAWKVVQEEKKRAKASAAFEAMDLNQDQILTADELTSRIEFDKDSDGTVTKEEASYYLLGKEESQLDRFLDEIWDGIRHVYRPPASADIPTLPPPLPDDVQVPEVTPAPTTTLPTPPKEESIPGEDEDYQEKDEDTEEEVTGDEVEDFDADKYMKEGEKSVEALEEDEPMPDWDPHTKTLIDHAEAVRKEYDDIDRKFSDLDRDIKQVEDFLKMDFGPEHEFAPLKDQCFELHESQYVYKLCMFGRATQKDKSGGSETSLGNWDQWEGPDDDKYSVQKYTKGQSCWNGPERSTVVRLKCGSETKLLSASEPGRCEYEFEMETPAVCKELYSGHFGDEL